MTVHGVVSTYLIQIDYGNATGGPKFPKQISREKESLGDHSLITSSHFWDFWTPFPPPLRQHVFSTKNKQKLAFSDPPPYPPQVRT